MYVYQYSTMSINWFIFFPKMSTLKVYTLYTVYSVISAPCYFSSFFTSKWFHPIIYLPGHSRNRDTLSRKNSLSLIRSLKTRAKEAKIKRGQIFPCIQYQFALAMSVHGMNCKIIWRFDLAHLFGKDLVSSSWKWYSSYYNHSLKKVASNMKTFYIQ